MTAHLSGTVSMFGREAELARLRQMLAATLRGNGGTVLIGGAAGIGKTTLVDELARSAREVGADVVTGGSYDFSITPPYGPWKDAAERTGWPELAALLGHEAGEAYPDGQDGLFSRAMRLILERAAAKSMLIVLEDLHWADSASLDLLRFVARHTLGHNVLLALTYRDDELVRHDLLNRLLPLLVREVRAERIDLRTLDDANVRALVGQRYRLEPADEGLLVSYLQQHAEGNPFFLGEVLRTLESEQLLLRTSSGWSVGKLDRAPVPPLVLQIVEVRLSRLDATTRRLLEAAAVIGQVVSFEIWKRTMRADADELFSAIEQASAAHVLTWIPGDTRLHFAHALTREALYSGIPPPQRRALHHQVADALLELGEPDPDEVSYHFRQCGDPRALEWLVRSGLRARLSGAWITAADRFRLAAQHLEGISDHARERGWLLFYTGYLLRFSGGASIRDYLDEAERIALAAADPLLAAYVLYHRGSSRCMRGEVRKGLAEIERGVRWLIELSVETQVLETEAQVRSIIQTLTSDDAPGGDWTRASSPAGNQPARQVIWQRGVLINWLGLSGHFREAMAAGEAFVSELDGAIDAYQGRPGQGASGFLGLGHAYAALGRPDDAQRLYETARTDFIIASDNSMVEYSINCELLGVTLPYRTGHLSERARLRADAANAWARSHGSTSVTSDGRAPSELALCILEGHWESAYQLALEMCSASTIREYQEAIFSLASLGHKRGDPDLAREHVLRLLPEGPATEPGDSYFPHAIATIAVAADMTLDADDLDTASAWIQAHSRWLEWSGAVLWLAQNRLLRARYHGLSGDLERARSLARNALELATDPRQPLQLLSAHRFIAELDILEGAHESAGEHLQRAEALAEACRVPYEAGLTMLVTAGLHAVTGHLKDATASAERARDIFSGLGARPAMEHADRLINDITSQTAGSQAHPDGLTRREAEVLRLIAQGKSNRAIAGELFLSHRTVERHIANIYLKIHVHSKAEATAFALRRNLA